MPSVDISQVPELVAHQGGDVMFESYREAPLVFPEFARVRGPEALGVSEYGLKDSVIEGFEPHKEREDGEEIEAGTFNSAFSWYLKYRQFSRKLEIPARMLRAVDAEAKVGSMVREFASKMGRLARLEKDDRVAGMMQKGTLTAGSLKYFDNSFPGNTDPHPKFIYDGLPWFDGAHTITGASSTYSNINTSLALTQANLESVITIMTSDNAVNERGERVFINPTVLVVPPGLEYTARVILGSAQVTGSQNNDINPIAGRLRLVVNRALSDAASASAWWVMEAGEGLEVIDSGVPRLRTAYDPDKDVVKVYSEYEFGASVSNWRYHYAANKADS